MSELPNGWNSAKLESVVDLRTGPFGSSLHKSDYVESGIPVINPMHIENGRINASRKHRVSQETAERLSEFRLEAGDIVIGRRGEMGRCAVVQAHQVGWLCGTGSLIVRPQQGIASDFLQGLLSSEAVVNYLTAESVGTTMVNLNQRILLDLDVLIPPSNEQSRIVEKLEEVLSDLDAGVVELKAAQRKLAQYRQSLLKAAVQGELTADWRAAQGNPKETGSELLQRILDERRARWEKKQLAKFTELGKRPPIGWQEKYPTPVSPDLGERPSLPKGWTWATIDQLAIEQKYGSSAKTNEDNRGVPVLRMGNIQNGELDCRPLKYLPKDHDELPELILDDGDMLFNRTNSPELVGKTAIYRSQVSPCSYASYLIAVRFTKLLVPELASAYINSVHGRNWIKAVVVQQVGQANVNGTKLSALAVPLPPIDEQSEIFSALEAHLAAVKEQDAAIHRGLQQASAQRKNILKAAFAGQLVPQDLNDETASELLTRILASREKQNFTTTRKRGRKAKNTV